MNHIVFLILIILIAVVLPSIFNLSKFSEGFHSNSNTLAGATGPYSASEDDVLVGDSYPITGKNGVSDLNYNQIWYYYPTFREGSYAQITNNIKYPNNPDNGWCTRAEFCGALYKDRQQKTNYVMPLPPVPPTEDGTRVNYYNTNINMLPFRNDMPNILY
jgi:type II secretory pathway pseudopilin PulG